MGYCTLDDVDEILAKALSCVSESDILIPLYHIPLRSSTEEDKSEKEDSDNTQES